MTITVHLFPAQFTEQESLLVDHPEWRVTALRFNTGIPALRVVGARVQALILPWRGQQIWSLAFDGESVGMRGMTPEPTAGQGLLDSFGAFFFHCGLLGTAAPGPGDDHTQHGELPIAPMSDAWLEIDRDSGALTVKSHRAYAKAFRAHYHAEPFVRFRPQHREISVGITVKNAGYSSMPFMYLGHPNFRPVDGATLAWSAPYGTQALRLHTLPASAPEGSAQRALLDRLAVDPMVHQRIVPGQAVNPETVFQIDYLADEQGWAHTLQVHPDGSSDAVAHQVGSCPRALRWLSRTPDVDALAFVEPSTSWLGGYNAELAAGNVPMLASGASWNTEMRIARLTVAETEARLALIDRIAGRL